MNKHSGFTLVEVAITLFIIGVLIAVGTVGYISLRERSVFENAKGELAAFAKIAERYKADTSSYPSSTNQLINAYAVDFTAHLFSDTNYYNLVYCTASPYASYALLAVARDGRRIYVTHADAEVKEYTGGVDWGGTSAATLCGSILSGTTDAGPVGFQRTGGAPNGWRPWTNAS